MSTQTRPAVSGTASEPELLLAERWPKLEAPAPTCHAHSGGGRRLCGIEIFEMKEGRRRNIWVACGVEVDGGAEFGGVKQGAVGRAGDGDFPTRRALCAAYTG
jgi:hypothetical protein